MQECLLQSATFSCLSAHSEKETARIEMMFDVLTAAEIGDCMEGCMEAIWKAHLSPAVSQTHVLASKSRLGSNRLEDDNELQTVRTGE